MSPTNRDVIVIGASAGGVEALQRVVGGLSADLPASVFIVLHLWAGTESFLPAILSRSGPLRAVQAVHDMPIERGKIYVAPPDNHLLLDAHRVLVVHGPRENRARPAINPLFRSAAAAFRERVMGVILTGTLDDGAAGLWTVQRCGGITIVQSDAAFDEMPRAAVESVSVDHHIPLAEIGPLLSRRSRESVLPSEAIQVPEITRMNDNGARMKPAGFNLDQVGRRSVFSCPECNGALWELEEGALQYRCHVGHAYSAESLKQAQNGTIEQALWSAVRALKESAALDGRLADRAAQHGLDTAADVHRRNASEKWNRSRTCRSFSAPCSRRPAGRSRGDGVRFFRLAK